MEERVKPIVKLTGQDGNAVIILGRASKALREADYKQTEIDAFIKEATSSDYDNLLQTVMKWVDVK